MESELLKAIQHVDKLISDGLHESTNLLRAQRDEMYNQYYLQYQPKFDLIPNWLMPDDVAINIPIKGNSLVLHPFVLSRFVGYHFGYEKGFELLQRFLHEKIDMKFKAIRLSD
jgi:hypothetical protein